ncbi:hypothetical protein [Kitasatospora acidiphila]|uniref:hypothetical protein n=1 Tax=Kitasatospora acidiphila TaxID=2567942 RepID=UPI001E2CB8B3|nr:hypothetical protein [Kitasatospora acidiphila]
MVDRIGGQFACQEFAGIRIATDGLAAPSDESSDRWDRYGLGCEIFGPNQADLLTQMNVIEQIVHDPSTDPAGGVVHHPGRITLRNRLIALGTGEMFLVRGSRAQANP